MHCCEKSLVYIKKIICLYLVKHSQKSLCPEKISLISFMIINDNVLKPGWNRKLSHAMLSK